METISPFVYADTDLWNASNSPNLDAFESRPSPQEPITTVSPVDLGLDYRKANHQHV